MLTIVITGSATLKVLDVSHNNIGDEGMEVISEVLQDNTSLTKLRVVKCGFSVKGNCGMWIYIVSLQLGEIILARFIVVNLRLRKACCVFRAWRFARFCIYLMSVVLKVKFF